MIFCSLTSKDESLKIKLDIGIMPMYNLDMLKRSSKKRMDTNRLAKSIVDEATTEEVLQEIADEGGKNPAAVTLGRLGGLKGGKARAKKLSAEQRRKIAQEAAKTRWGKKQSK